jgi:hypothetical protein
MKKIIVAALTLCLAVSAFAGIGVDWNTQAFGIYLNGSSGLDPTVTSELALTGSDLLWQLIFSADTTADPIDLENASGGYVSGDDQVLADRTINKAPDGAGYDSIVDADDGTSWMVAGLNASGDTKLIDDSWSTAGNVYQRVFGGTPAEGVWYFESGLETLNTAFDPSLPAQGLYIDSLEGGAVLNKQIPVSPTPPEPPVIPEPATMSLLGLGAMAMVLRRKLRK